MEKKKLLQISFGLSIALIVLSIVHTCQIARQLKELCAPAKACDCDCAETEPEA